MTWHHRATQGYLEYEPHIVGGLSLHLTRQHHGSEAGHPPDLIDTRLLPYCRQSSDSAHDAKVRRPSFSVPRVSSTAKLVMSVAAAAVV